MSASVRRGAQAGGWKPILQAVGHARGKINVAKRETAQKPTGQDEINIGLNTRTMLTGAQRPHIRKVGVHRRAQCQLPTPCRWN